MARIPQYDREVAPQLTPTPYKRAYVNPLAFDSGKGLEGMTNAIDNINVALGNIQNRIDNTHLLELKNKDVEWQQTKLYDKENGYYYKTGKDAYGQSEALVQDYENYMNDYIKNTKMSPAARQRAIETVAHLKQGILHNVSIHDYKEGINWANNEADIAKTNYINTAVNMRDNDDEINKAIQSGYQIIEFQAEIQHLDQTAVNLEKMKYRSNIHESVLNAKIADNSLTAGQYFEQHKSEIMPDKIPHYIEAIKNNEVRYESVNIAQNIIANSPNEESAIKEAEKIEDTDMSDAVMSRVKKYYDTQEYTKKLHEQEELKNFYDKDLTARQSGTGLSYDDIPQDLDAETKLGLMNYINKNYAPDTDDGTWEFLHDMSVNNAQQFASEDLNRYRGFLSDGDYKSLLKRQEDIKNGNFYSNIKDDDKLLKSILEQMGLKKGKEESAFNEIRGLTREIEARKGRKITDEELLNITKSLGYKGSDGVKIYRRLEQGMAKRTGFLRDVANDFIYYQNKHNGQMPSDEEKYKIITNRANQLMQQQKNQAQKTIENYTSDSNYINQITAITPKPNEQKVTTYFSDTVAPQLSKELGFPVRITSRYRDSAGSKHKEGRAVDVGMAKETPQQRIQIYQKLINLPYIKAIGCSDENILAYFNGKTNKIIDERKYDIQHGTNHKNHAHITFYNDSEIIRKNDNRIAMKNGNYEL